ESRTKVSPMPRLARISAGTEPWVISAGCSIRLSTPPRLSAKANSLHRSRKRRGAANGPPNPAQSHPPQTRRSLFPHPRLGGGREPGVEHAPDPGVAFEPRGDLPRRGAMTLHAQRQRLEPAQRQERIERPLDRADGVLQEFEFIAQLGIPAYDRHTADHVG